MMEHSGLLVTSAILDFKHLEISKLVKERNWRFLPRFEAIGGVYDFVRNEIKFGYNRADDIPASEVLENGYGQCNTKANLLMALLRSISVPCRLRGFTIHKNLQRGIVPEPIYYITPENILHTWVEIYFDGKWINLEGFILDKEFLGQLQKTFKSSSDNFCGYGVGTPDLQNPAVEWNGKDTYIQNTAINQEFGLFDSPDDFYAEHQQDFSIWKNMLFEYLVRHLMNARVKKIRKGHRPRALPSVACEVKPLASQESAG